MSTVERLNKFFHPCFLPITFFLLRVYTSIRPSTCLPLKCLRAGSACLPPTRSVCVPCALFVDSAAATPCIRTSPAESFSRPEVFCSGIDLIAPVCLQSGASKPHRNWQTRQNCSAFIRRVRKQVAHKGVSGAESKLRHKRGAQIAVIRTPRR